MALTKQTIVDKIEVMANNNIQVRTATQILEDDVVISQSYHRHVLEQGDDLTNEDAKVAAVANAAWS